MNQSRCEDISDMPWRQRLGAWLRNLPPGQRVPLSAEDIEILLPLAVDDVFLGKDVIGRYPALFQAMVDDDDLAERFLLAIELLENEDAVEEASATAVDMDAVRRHPAPVQLAIDGARHWRIEWHKLKEQLSASLFPPRSQSMPVMRGPDASSSCHVVQETVTVDGLEVDVALLLEQSLAAEDQAAVTLLATTTPEKKNLALEATVKWGDYEAGGRVDPYGLLVLAPLTLSSVVDFERRVVLHDLDISLAVSND